jgi:hypothetical protein
MPIAPLVGAAIIGGGAQLAGSAFQSRGVGQAANRQASASKYAADLASKTAGEQLDYTKGQSRYLMAQAEKNREADFYLDETEKINEEARYWDSTRNKRGLTEQEAQQAYANQIAQGRNQYAHWEASDQRKGTLGQLTNMGSRFIPGRAEAPLVPFADLQRTPHIRNEYVPGQKGIPVDPAIAANAERDAERYAAIQRQAAAPYQNYTPLPGTRTV